MKKPSAYFVVIAILFSQIFSFCGSYEPSPPDEIEAFVISQHFVKLNLIAPATADFPFLDRTVWKQNDSTFVVKSYVDAQNAFGAKIRNNYKCTLKYTGGDGADHRNWQLLNIEIW